MSNDIACSISTVEIADFMTGFVAATYAFASFFSALVPDIRMELAIGQDVIGYHLQA